MTFTLMLTLITIKIVLLWFAWFTTIGSVLYFGLDADLGVQVYLIIRYMLELPLYLVIGYYLLRASARRLGRRALLWMWGAVGGAGALLIMVTTQNANRPDELPSDMLSFVILGVLAVIAVHSARRSLAAFAARRLVERLPTREAIALAEWIDQRATPADPP